MQEFVAYHHLCSLSSVNNITSASSFPYCPPLNVVVLKGNEREREREREERERIGGYIAYKRLPTVPIYRRARKEGP
jgi:hypothetical protein